MSVMITIIIIIINKLCVFFMSLWWADSMMNEMKLNDEEDKAK